jgi:putative PIG3 family NAD(P)H quinone oxidoreductase
MRAVVFSGKGGPEVIEIREIPDPSPQRGEALVRVRAAALNRADLLQRRGLYPPPPGVRPDVPGLELAGEVVAVGEGVSSVAKGDRVMAIAGGEGQAELAVAHERMLVRVPERLSWDEAGAVMEAFVTSHDALFTLGGLRPGWPVLVHAVGSGVATAALQLARAAGATVIGTSRTGEKLERARELGLAHGVLVGKDEPRFADEVRRLTGGEGVPLVLDFVGGAYTAENVGALATGGRVVVIGTMAGAKAPVDLSLLMRRRGEVIGTVLRPRPLEDKVRATRLFAKDVLPLLASGAVRPVIDAAFSLDRVREAHERMERNDSFGKLVLSL